MMTNALREADVRLLFENDVPTGGAYEDVGSGIQASSTAGSLYVSLHTGALTASSTQSTNEVTYAAYSRQAVARGSSAWDFTSASTGIVSNANAITWTKSATTGSEEALWVGLGTDASGAGNLLRYTPLALSDPQVFVVDDSLSADTLIMPGHGLSNGDRAMVASGIAGTIPGLLSASTAYWVVNANTDDLQLSTTEGGLGVSIGNGSGFLYEMNPITITLNSTPSIAAGALIFKSE